MEAMSNNLIWSSKLDEAFLCKVERVESSQGKLTIHNKTGGLLLLRDVELTFDEKLGPTLQDVAKWQEICIGFIDDAA